MRQVGPPEDSFPLRGVVSSSLFQVNRRIVHHQVEPAMARGNRFLPISAYDSLPAADVGFLERTPHPEAARRIA